MNILKILTPRRVLGNFGEDEACKYLKKQGYKIIERNYVAVGKEIDIIAKNKEYTVFIEVKTRSLGKEHPNEPRPASAVTPAKQRDIIRAAKCYITNSRTEGHVRFDVIEVYTVTDGEKTRVSDIKHLIGAFDYNTANRKG